MVAHRPGAVQEYLRQWEHDACALLGIVHKDGEATRGLVDAALEALVAMAHRSGDVDGEGDGCGVQTDIPRALWASLLVEAGHAPELAFDPRFAVGHFFIPRPEAYWARALKEQVLRRLTADGALVLVERTAPTDPSALGPLGRLDEPEFWQVALLVPEVGAPEPQLFRWTLAIEEETPVQVVSLSTETAVYKVRGGPHTLRQYFEDLRNPRFATRSVIGHNRYSTNTSTAFERVQPFHLLGHNGEINTIRQLREQTEMLGIALTRGGSDSQDLDRLLAGLLHQYGFTLAEAMEMVFPPVIGDIKLLRPELQDLYMYLRQAWGPFAQGPAAVVARAGAELVASVDALGLRPLWLLETEEAFYFSSEPGVVPLADLVRDPKPLAPGEKVLVILRSEGPVEVVPHHQMQERVLGFIERRLLRPRGWRRFIEVGGPPGYFPLVPVPAPPPPPPQPSESLLAAMGWSQEDHQLVREMAARGSEPIGSLGYDGPLACLSEERQNLADYFKETVAVVTNPAIDREREVEHFSTRVVLGVRPPIALRGRSDHALVHRTRIELRLPLLLGGHAGEAPLDRATYRELARAHGTYLYEDLLLEWDPVHGAPRDPGVIRFLSTSFRPTESLAQALARLGRQAVSAVLEGAELLVLDDAECFRDENLWIDPHLAVSTVDLALKRHPVQEGQANFRRRVGIVLRSGAIRNLHDLILAVGLGADAVNPYLLLDVAAHGDPRAGLDNIVSALQKGLEKVISTLGIHELRGYSRLFSSIGLKPEVARYFDTVHYCGSDQGGLGLARLKADAAERYAIANGLVPGARMARTFRIWPRIWKSLGEVAAGRAPYSAYTQKLQNIERETPISLRHLLDLREQKPVDPASVDTTIEDYAYPITISGMSFGSQGEVAFRSYAEAARRLDIVCMNGEGGEIPDMVGRYFKWRGQQVASGRFGVHARMLAGSRFMEIKIGQGAKPGEGGHLPGMKVTEKVARARNAIPGIDLISPSNNHDIYSIEDLAQIVEELHTVNPHGKVVVKVPVVPGIGTIAVGIAKSGADVIALCGYDGGTGAARKHALRHAGLPIEIGVREAHLALTAAGVRGRVEIWADSGIKSGLDVVKLILLGANRVGFGTLAMVAVGCTACRGCHLDTCHVGIATQIESREEAVARGLKHFSPREFETSVQQLVTVLRAIGEEVRELTARLGFRRTQDLVGRAELLQQVRGLGRADLRELTMPTPVPLELLPDRAHGPVRRVENPLAVEIAAVAHSHVRTAAGSSSRSQWSGVTARDRILGTALAGRLAWDGLAADLEEGLGGCGSGEDRPQLPAGDERDPAESGSGSPPSTTAPVGTTAEIVLEEGSVAGNGFGAFNLHGMRLVVRGGAQDGVGKGMLGGEIVVLKGLNRYGGQVGGSVGKSFAYGAQRGLLVVQGDADARCGIRLSGADVIIGGRLRAPLDDSLGLLAERANLKGFAFEYMTRGRAVVLGDPGPWLCSGMTGGVVYVLLQPELGLDEAAVRRRLAKGARVNLMRPGSRGKKDLTELLGRYHQILLDSGQQEEAGEVLQLMLDCERRFLAIVPVTQQVDPSMATE